MEVASGQEGIARETKYLVASRLTSYSTGQGSSRTAPLTIGVLTEDDGCCLSPGLLLLESRDPPRICSVGLWLPRIRHEGTLQSPVRDFFPSQAGLNVGMIQAQGREETKGLAVRPFGLRIQDYRVQLAAH